MTVVSGHIIQRGSPLSVSEVGEVLGTADRTLTGICRSATVNRHARFKPYPFGGILPDGITEDIIKAANFGMAAKLLDFTKLPSDSAMATASQLAAVEQVWTQWRRPTGKQADNEPLRLGDFSGYDHLAKADIGSVTFDNKWVEGSPQALRDGWLRATVNFSPGEDFRVYLSDFSYNGTALEDMYLTLLVIKAHRYGSSGNSISWTQKYFAAQSSQTLKQLRPTGSAAVEIDLSLVSEAVMASFMADSDNLGQSSGNAVAVGLAPKIEGLTDEDGAPQLITAAGTLPQLVSLNMFDEPMGTVNCSAMLGTAESSGAVVKEYFDVTGYVEVRQNSQVGQTSAAWATVDSQQGIRVRVGGQFALMPTTIAEGHSGDGRFKLNIVATATGADGESVSESRVIVTPEGMREYTFGVSNGTVGSIYAEGEVVGSGALNGVNDATLKSLSGGIFLPFAGTAASVTVNCTVEGYPTGTANKQLWPALHDRGGYQSWSAELLSKSISRT